KAVIPHLFVHGKGPAPRRWRFLDRVTVTDLAVGLQGAAVQQVGVRHALAAIDLGPVVHAAQAGPALFNQSDRVVRTFNDQDGSLFAARLVFVDIGAALSVHTGRFRPAEDPAGEFNSMTAHVHEHAAAAAVHGPEPIGMGAEVLLTLLDEIHLAESAFVHQLF